VFVKIGSNIDRGSLDGLEEHFLSNRSQDTSVKRERERMQDGNIYTCYSRLFYIYKMGLEHAFRSFVSFRTDFDHTTIWELSGVSLVDKI
jgi:hypothetical protein